jgi:molybdopterin-containing oxidoreductase family iron-sulfur binding subunit
MSSTPKYWTGLEELNETPEFIRNRETEFPANQSVDEFLGDSGINDIKTGRRDFLKFLGFSVAAATLASCEAPVIKSIPYVNRPEDITPGLANWYASAYYDGTDYATTLVKTREGRPIHITGNREYGRELSGLSARVVASVLPLYDSERLKNPTIDGAEVSWDDVDAEVISRLNAVSQKGGKIRVLTNTVISPSLNSAIMELAARFGKPMDIASAPAPVEEPAAAAAAPVVAVADSVAASEPVMPEMVYNGNADFKVVAYDAVSYNGIRKANQKTFGKAVIPSYDFSKAEVIVSVSADFLGNWLIGNAYSVQYVQGRKPENGKMSRHFQFETLMTLAGSSADVRRRIKPSQQALVVAALYDAVGGNSGVDTSSLDAGVLEAVKMAGEELKAAKGKGLVVAGDNDEHTQILVNAINNTLSNYGADKAINLDKPLMLFAADDAEVEALAKSVAGEGEKIDALIIAGVNPVYSLPNGKAFGEGLANIGTTICFSQYADETASRCQIVCAENHYLESWADHSPIEGHYTVAQPTIRPLYNTTTVMESVLVWAGKAARSSKATRGSVEHKHMRSLWEMHGYPEEKDKFATFDDYWNKTVMIGVSDIAMPTTPAGAFNAAAVIEATSGINKHPKGGNWEVEMYQKNGMGVGNHANNPWLQEMPDPISKVTWDNYITLAPKDLDAQGFNKYIGQEHPASMATVKVGDVEFKLPVIAQPGQAEGTIGIALGYGRGEGGEKIGKAAYHCGEYGDYEEGENGGRMMIGQNAFKLASFREGTLRMDAMEAELSSADETYQIAATQTHHTVMGRDSIIRETTLGFYRTGQKENIFDEEKKEWREGFNPMHTLPVHEDVNGDGHIDSQDRKHISEFDLWDEHPVEKVGHRWGMTIDLGACTGCGACTIACHSENNVPVVGKDEIRRVRDMFWLRIDRYYSSAHEDLIGKRKEEWSYGEMENPEDNPKVVFMPVMCQHCNHAPCETVCPVVATTHSNEGINQMTYNRCIGTRYCANNCPYKVRRFNWFNYPQYKKFTAFNPAQDSMQRMVLNPDVTVRSRGVMEKCSMCIQRIQEGKLAAKIAKRPLQDSDVTSACAAACSTGAIIFGDLNDMANEEKGTKGSLVYQHAISDRSYHMLEEVGTRPNIFYKVKVRNIELEAAAEENNEHA